MDSMTTREPHLHDHRTLQVAELPFQKLPCAVSRDFSNFWRPIHPQPMKSAGIDHLLSKDGDLLVLGKIIWKFFGQVKMITYLVIN